MTRIPVLLLLSALSAAAQADEPISASSTTNFCSPSHQFCASSSRSERSTTITPQNGNGHPWKFSDFVQVGLLSDDGNWLGSCYGGLNLVPSDAGPDFLIAVIYGRDGSKRPVRLGEVIPDPSKLPSTESHKEWGVCRSISNTGLKIERFDGSSVELPVN